MSPELYAAMRDLLERGTEQQKRHARFRLAQPDAPGHEGADGGPPPPEPEPAPQPPDPDDARIRACPDYNPACCSSPAPFCTRFLISPTREQCLKCLRDEDWERFSLPP